LDATSTAEEKPLRTDSETKPKDTEQLKTLDFSSFNPNGTGPDSQAAEVRLR